MVSVTVYTDGASRGNPGLAGAGAAISIPPSALVDQEKQLQINLLGFIGSKTNNQAEYLAVLLALRWLQEHSSGFVSGVKIEFFLDSQLVVNQLNKDWKIKHKGLRPLAEKCWQLLQQISQKTEISYIPREKNQLADSLANQAIDFSQV